MLDAYIIEQLQRERERSQTTYVPLYIEPPQPFLDRDEEPEGKEEDGDTDHGVVIIDYFIDQDE